MTRRRLEDERDLGPGLDRLAVAATGHVPHLEHLFCQSAVEVAIRRGRRELHLSDRFTFSIDEHAGCHPHPSHPGRRIPFRDEGPWHRIRGAGPRSAKPASRSGAGTGRCTARKPWCAQRHRQRASLQGLDSRLIGHLGPIGRGRDLERMRSGDSDRLERSAREGGGNRHGRRGRAGRGTGGRRPPREEQGAVHERRDEERPAEDASLPPVPPLGGQSVSLSHGRRYTHRGAGFRSLSHTSYPDTFSSAGCTG